MTGIANVQSAVHHGRDVLLVATGGALGASARYGIELIVGPIVGTLTVNVVGAFVLALITARLLDRRIMLFAGIGFLSSFTTYSTFVSDAVSAEPTGAAGYVTASYAGGFLAAVAGLAIGGRR
ncbi:CrcB family protein [Halopenitus sp. H-Gu1]|uniref:fluoride efflux transporter FluC n=1 Tax=Halopenitus sp. H-Gu1 TaxID=3242697 RepID=UPI00359E3D53